jgi:IS1 family transposase
MLHHSDPCVRVGKLLSSNFFQRSRETGHNLFRLRYKEQTETPDMRTLYSPFDSGKSKCMKRKKEKRPIEGIHIPHCERQAHTVGFKTSTEE